MKNVGGKVGDRTEIPDEVRECANAQPWTGRGMTAPLEVTESSSTAQPEAALQGMSRKAIQGRSLGQIAWLRLKRDKVAMTAGIVVLALIMVAVFAPLIVKLLGYPPDEFHQDEI